MITAFIELRIRDAEMKVITGLEIIFTEQAILANYLWTVSCCPVDSVHPMDPSCLFLIKAPISSIL